VDKGQFGDAQPRKEGSSVCRYCYCEVKQWVGLTDEEVLLIYRDQANQDFQMRLDPFKLYAAFEAKLKDKNNA
jgi:hypothetical protein